MAPRTQSLTGLLREVRACTRCARFLPEGPRPILIARPGATILVAGQAPGRKVHETGIPWNDASGERLRAWLGVTREEFYDARRVAIVPMGFCYPGKGPSGDNPPRPECRQTWHDALFARLPKLELRIVIGSYAHDYHLHGRKGKSLTDTIRAWRDFAPEVFPLPHPSPRNQLWLRKNPWFEHDVIPVLQRAVRLRLDRSA
jgi:uracil-DNA glycosylase